MERNKPYVLLLMPACHSPSPLSSACRRDEESCSQGCFTSITLLWPKHSGAGRGKQRGKRWFEGGPEKRVQEKLRETPL